jgi:hypothetical protein
VLLAALPLVALTGCMVSDKGSNGNDNVTIKTPFGGMDVKTNEAAKVDTGIPVYPGATPDKEGDKKDKESADVNMNFGSFHLRVKAAGYLTPDSPDKVKGWYKKELASRFGEVIECRDNHAVGKPDHTSQGLTCEENKNQPKVKVDALNEEGELQLKTGSKGHQHIVAIEHKDGGTKLGLVELELPNIKDDSGDGKVSN